MQGRMFQLGQLKYTNTYAARPGTTIRKMIVKLPLQLATLFHIHCFLPCCFLLCVCENCLRMHSDIAICILMSILFCCLEVQHVINFPFYSCEYDVKLIKFANA